LDLDREKGETRRETREGRQEKGETRREAREGRNQEETIWEYGR
jgi:hypothetical protein